MRVSGIGEGSVRLRISPRVAGIPAKFGNYNMNRRSGPEARSRRLLTAVLGTRCDQNGLVRVRPHIQPPSILRWLGCNPVIAHQNDTGEGPFPFGQQPGDLTVYDQTRTRWPMGEAVRKGMSACELLPRRVKPVSGTSLLRSPCAQRRGLDCSGLQPELCGEEEPHEAHPKNRANKGDDAFGNRECDRQKDVVGEFRVTTE